MFIVRRKDPPVYEGAKTFWITVAKRKTPVWKTEEEFFAWLGVKFIPPEKREL
jgi:DNA polymerase beta thumb